MALALDEVRKKKPVIDPVRNPARLALKIAAIIYYPVSRRTSRLRGKGATAFKGCPRFPTWTSAARDGFLLELLERRLRLPGLAWAAGIAQELHLVAVHQRSFRQPTASRGKCG